MSQCQRAMRLGGGVGVVFCVNESDHERAGHRFEFTLAEEEVERVNAANDPDESPQAVSGLKEGE